MTDKPCGCPKYEWEYTTNDLCAFDHARAILLRLCDLNATAGVPGDDYRRLIDVAARRICPSELTEEGRKEWRATTDRMRALMIAA